MYHVDHRQKLKGFDVHIMLCLEAKMAVRYSGQMCLSFYIDMEYRTYLLINNCLDALAPVFVAYEGVAKFEISAVPGVNVDLAVVHAGKQKVDCFS